MPSHEVSFEIPQKLALSKDIKFDIRSDGAKLGTLLISQGNIEWVPANHSVHKHRLTWERFARLMEEQGRTKRMKRS